MSLSLPLGSVSFNQNEMTFCLADPTSLPRLKFRATKKPTGTGSREEGRFRMIDKSRSYSVVYDRGIDPFLNPFPIPLLVHSRPTTIMVTPPWIKSGYNNLPKSLKHWLSDLQGIPLSIPPSAPQSDHKLVQESL